MFNTYSTNRMEHIKKRLVFYFYTFDGFKNNRAIQIHLKCLSHYSHVFDEALFIISLDDVENKQLIFNTEAELLKTGFRDIHFKVHKNNGYCEAQPFWEEIVSKLDVLDGLTFFGHTKGITNYQNENISKTSIDTWILGMYYLNLEFIKEVEQYMTFYSARFYGAFLTDNREWNGVNWLYTGTFFWLNCPMIYVDFQTGEKKKPTTYHQRGFAESFPGLICEWKPYCPELSSHELRVLGGGYNAYCNTPDVMKFLLGNEEDDFNLFKKDILAEIGEVNQ